MFLAHDYVRIQDKEEKFKELENTVNCRQKNKVAKVNSIWALSAISSNWYHLLCMKNSSSSYPKIKLNYNNFVARLMTDKLDSFAFKISVVGYVLFLKRGHDR
jgi:hypothetical protein